MARLSSLDSLSKNKKSIIFGDQGDNLMGSLEPLKWFTTRKMID